MIKRKLSMTEFEEELGKGFDHVLLCKLSSVEILSAGEYVGIDDEVTEARFFDAGREVRLFEQNGEKRAVLIEDEENDIADIKIERLKGNTLNIKKYISFDEDGQAYIEAIRLCGAE